MMALVVLMVGLTGCKSKTETALEIASKTSTEVTEKTTEEMTGEVQEVTSTVEIVATKKDENRTDESTEATENSGNRQQSTTEGNRTTTGSIGVSNSNSSDASAGSNSTSVSVSEPESVAVSYSPQNVVALATSKCQAGGMITTQQNLDNLLAAGSISQDEYNQYYPYDGMEESYYSVFVETDLTKASTIDGKPLPSEDAIADYIAGMLMLETDPVFYISYDGIYTTGGTTFYEFRCHR